MMLEFDPTRCAHCGGPLKADYVVIDQGTLCWTLCTWECAGEFARNPDRRKAADSAPSTLYRAWVRGPIRWYTYRTGKGALLRKITEHLIPFASLSGAVAAAQSEAGPNATEISTKAR